MSIAATIRCGNIAGLATVASHLGLEFADLLNRVGIPLGTFDDPEAHVPVAALDTLLLLAQQRSGCDCIGHLIGSLPTDLGLPAYIALNAPTVHDALKDMVALHALTNSGGELYLRERAAEGLAEFGFAMALPGTRTASQISDGAIAQSFSLIRSLCGDQFRAIEIKLTRKPPKDVEAFDKHYCGQRLSFNASEAAIVFAREYLGRNIPGANPNLYRYLKQEVLNSKRPAVDESIIVSVRRTVLKLLKYQPATSMLVGNLLGMHPRTLSRRLAHEGTDLTEIIESVRQELACQLLADTDLSIGEISSRLHYSELSSFTRAFRRWSGLSPIRWRRNRATEGQDTPAKTIPLAPPPDMDTPRQA